MLLGCLLAGVLVAGTRASAQPADLNRISTIVRFAVDRASIPLAAVETGSETARFSWHVINVDERHRLSHRTLNRSSVRT